MARLVALSVPAMLLTLAASDWAYSRNCTAQEKESANARLLEIEDSPKLQASLVKRHAPWGVHRSTGSVAGERMLHQDGYLLSHDSDLRTSLWVAYRLSGPEIEAGGGKERVNCFRKDPRMTRAETATTTDYNEPRFDQGHMANDRDLKDVLQEQVNTYIMSNMSPQEDCFNRGIWLSLEHQVRRWARAYGEVYVTSGAIFDRNGDGVRDADDEAQRMISRNGQSRIAVPTHYYKVVWRHEGDRILSITLMLEHTDQIYGSTWTDVQPHVLDSITDIATIERRAGVTLHPSAPRARVVQTKNGEGWILNQGTANYFAKRCKPTN